MLGRGRPPLLEDQPEGDFYVCSRSLAWMDATTVVDKAVLPRKTASRIDSAAAALELSVTDQKPKKKDQSNL